MGESLGLRFRLGFPPKFRKGNPSPVQVQVDVSSRKIGLVTVNRNVVRPQGVFAIARHMDEPRIFFLAHLKSMAEKELEDLIS